MSQYKISKKRLAEIIKEEYQSYQQRKPRRLNEDASDDTFEMVDAIVTALGPQGALEELVQAMERSKAHELLGYIMQNHDIGHGEEEGVEDYNPEDDYNYRGHRAHYNRKDEQLKGGQKELDKDDDGDIDAEDMAALRNKKKKVKEEAKSAKPDFADLDKDGDKKEPMKKAAKEKEDKKEDDALEEIRNLIQQELKNL